MQDPKDKLIASLAEALRYYAEDELYLINIQLPSGHVTNLDDYIAGMILNTRTIFEDCGSKARRALAFLNQSS